MKIVKLYLGLAGVISASLIYCLNDNIARWAFPDLKPSREAWDKSYFLTQCGYAYIIGVIAAVFSRGNHTRQEIWVMTVLTGLAGGDITDRIWKAIVDPNLDLTKVTQADLILLIISIYYATKKYVNKAV